MAGFWSDSPEGEEIKNAIFDALKNGNGTPVKVGDYVSKNYTGLLPDKERTEQIFMIKAYLDNMVENKQIRVEDRRYRMKEAI